jgi:hypothetical protein
MRPARPTDEAHRGQMRQLVTWIDHETPFRRDIVVDTTTGW